MRFRYYMVVQDLAGNVVDGASVYVYLAGTSTPAVVYPTRTSSEGSNTPPQVSSRSRSPQAKIRNPTSAEGSN